MALGYLDPYSNLVRKEAVGVAKDAAKRAAKYGKLA
jgi:hypothetical protein